MNRPFSTLLLFLILPLTILLATKTAVSATVSLHYQLKHLKTQLPNHSVTQLPSYGLAFISSAESPADEQRYQNALLTGATWNRWPLYWPLIEATPGEFNWLNQDVAFIGDFSHALQTNAILLGTPPFYTTAPPTRKISPVRDELFLYEPERATPVGLFEPIFSDGTDVPGPEKSINPANVWARFVYEAISRYKPDGVLAQQNQWRGNIGITHWEIWNEPDLDFFWDGSNDEYGRLLKVAYLTAELADPNAQILLGGMAHFEDPNFYNQIMTLYDADPLAAPYGYFHDIVATHNYLYAWQSWHDADQINQTLAARGLEKPIWLNETGVPVWNDYPGPLCESTSPYRATMTEQADFIIQSAFYARMAGVDTFFFFQLYDDCGNVPGNHAYYPPESCSPTVTEPGGDAFGLFRNPTDAVCYTQHPQPETPRPSLAAYQLLTNYFIGVEPLWWQTNGGQEWLAFYKPTTEERIMGVWARYGVWETAVLPATNPSATLLTPDGAAQTIVATDGYYTLSLPPATNQNAIWDPTLFPIGGRPYILIESDTFPPEVVTLTAPITATNQITLSWAGRDMGSGMGSYDVTVITDGLTQTAWLTATTAVSATYPSEIGHVYTFIAQGRDQAGNLGAGTYAFVFTIQPYQLFLPAVNKP